MNSTRHKARTEGFFHQDSENEKLIRVHCYKEDYKNNIPCRIEFFDSIEDADKLLHKFRYNNIFYFDNKSDKLLLHECGDIASIEESTVKSVETDKWREEGIKETNGKVDYSEINLEILDLMAERFTANKHKYPKGNMKKSIDIKSLEWALFRHVKKMIQPIETDEESYKDHLSAVLCNASMILDQLNGK